MARAVVVGGGPAPAGDPGHGLLEVGGVRVQVLLGRGEAPGRQPTQNPVWRSLTVTTTIATKRAGPLSLRSRASSRLTRPPQVAAELGRRGGFGRCRRGRG